VRQILFLGATCACLLSVPSARPDPTSLVYKTFFGGSRNNTPVGIALDSQGNIYVAGQTNSADFPILNAVQDHPGAAALSTSSDGGRTFARAALRASAVNGLAAAPGTPAVLYAATDAGILKSPDGGSTWIAPPNAGLSTLSAAIAVDAGSADTVYAATAQGLYISTDGAFSWSLSSLGTVTAVNVVSHPAVPGTVFVMTQNPPFLSRSTDSGRTWTPLNIAPPNQPAFPRALVFDSTNPQNLILGQSLSGLLKSTDGGDTWAPLAGQNIQNTQSLAIDPANPAVLYAVSVIPGSGSGAVLKSSDGGQTFAVVLSGLTNFGNSIYPDPRHPGTVYVAGPTGFYSTMDAGQSWSRFPDPNPNAPFALIVTPLDSRVLVGSAASQDVFVTKWNPNGNQILYSTYLGGSGMDSASGIAVDATGSAYIVGTTSSPDFPITSGAFQQKLVGQDNAFIAKLSPDGSHLVYSTFLGEGSELTGGIAVDPSGSAIIIGTAQGGFPTTPNAFQTAPVTPCTISTGGPLNVPRAGSAFAARLAPDGGSLVYATLLGGSCATSGSGVALAANGDAWVTGTTDSPDFPVTPDALQPQFGGMPNLDFGDGFLARFDSSGHLAYATYLGGPSYDALTGITLDASGNIYLTGMSDGFSEPASPRAFQAKPSYGCSVGGIGPSVFTPQGSAFVMKLNAKAGAVSGLTYLGVPCSFSGNAIAVDSSGSPWIFGSAGFLPSFPLPTAGPLQIQIGNALLARFSPDLTQLQFSTYMDSTGGLALDSSGAAYAAGAGPGTGPLQAQQAYVAKIKPVPLPVSLDMIVPAGIPQPVPGLTHGVSPGQILRLMGKNMGPLVVTPGVVNSGVIATSVAGGQVTFNGVRAPLLTVSASEIDCIAPFELAGIITTAVRVQYNGVTSNAVQIPVTATGLEVLAVLNEDFTFNSASNPAKAGSVIILYIGGAGQTNPPGQDGQLNSLPPAQPGAPVTVAFGPTPYTVNFAGAAPGLAAGILQVNFVAPQQSSTNVSVRVGQSFALFSVAIQ
jgi:uncharacterized protein (TIGR03437 family)